MDSAGRSVGKPAGRRFDAAGPSPRSGRCHAAVEPPRGTARSLTSRTCCRSTPDEMALGETRGRTACGAASPGCLASEGCPAVRSRAMLPAIAERGPRELGCPSWASRRPARRGSRVPRSSRAPRPRSWSRPTRDGCCGSWRSDREVPRNRRTPRPTRRDGHSLGAAAPGTGVWARLELEFRLGA